jgi:hypothetical protein
MTSGSSRVLGGKAEAEAYLKRMEDLRVKQMEAAQVASRRAGDGQEPFDDESKEGG